MPAARRVAAAAAAVLVLGACQTGERPSFDTTPTGTDEGAAAATTPADDDPTTDDSVANGGATRRPGVASDLFDTSSPATETAVYEIFQTAQRVSATVTVSRTAGRTVVEVRGTQFRSDGDGRETCNEDTRVCRPEFAEQELSDLQITTGFWGPAVQRELDSPTLNARIGPITTSAETIAGQPASCVTIPGPSRSDRYCALASGMLASKVTAAVTIDLVEYEAQFDEALWNKIPG